MKKSCCGQRALASAFGVSPAIAEMVAAQEAQSQQLISSGVAKLGLFAGIFVAYKLFGGKK